MRPLDRQQLRQPESPDHDAVRDACQTAREGMSRTVVVDLGGVLLRWDPPALLGQVWPDLVPDRSTAVALASQVFQTFVPGGDWSEFDRGTIDPATLAARMSARVGLPAARVRTLLDVIPAHLCFLPDTVSLLNRLRRNGLRLVYLSNMPLPYADWLDGLEQFRSCFDDGVFSARVGLVKPEPEIFGLAEQRLGLDPASTMLLDDRPDNVAQALRHGWSGSVFTDSETAAADLTSRGWLLTP
jgi:putative hydrolase of the HAD superfamily